MKKFEKKKYVFYMVVTALLWSSGGLLIKLIDWSPVSIAGGRSVIAAVLIWIYVKKPELSLSKDQILASLAYSATVLLFVSATKLTTAANAILLQYTAPVYVALFSRWFLNERVYPRDWICIGMTLAGISVFFLDRLSFDGYLGNVLALLSGVAFAWLALLMRKLKDASPIDSILLGNILTGLLAMPFVVRETFTPGSLIGISLMGVFQLGFSYILYSVAVKHISAMDVIIIPVLEPLLNPVWVALFYGEIPALWAIAGGVIVISSITIRTLFQDKNEG